MDVQRYLTLALQGNIVFRGLKFSLIVGTILVLINHGDRLMGDELTLTQALQIGLTYLVPYVVSSLSSIQSIIIEQKGASQ